MKRWVVHARATFSAVHALPAYEGRPEQPHRHTWGVGVRIGTATLNAEGYAVDFHAVREALDRVLAPLDESDLNGHPVIGDLPSAERLAELIAAAMAPACRELGGTLLQVSVWEGAENRVDLLLE